jgi:hypothetical protein
VTTRSAVDLRPPKDHVWHKRSLNAVRKEEK